MNECTSILMKWPSMVSAGEQEIISYPHIQGDSVINRLLMWMDIIPSN